METSLKFDLQGASLKFGVFHYIWSATVQVSNGMEFVFTINSVFTISVVLHTGVTGTKHS